MLARLVSLCRNLRYRDRVERELDEEMKATLDLLIDEKVAAGFEPEAARRRAMIELGGIEPVKTRVREVRMGVRLEALAQDVKHAVRHFRRSPGFAVAAVATLALGIGANTAVFSMLHALQFERLAIADPNGLYSLSSYGDRKRYIPMPLVHELVREGPLQHVCGYNGGAILPVEANGRPMQITAAFVSGRCFDAFGVRPVMGRSIGDTDAPLVSPGNKVVVISDRLWRNVFNADPDVLGKVLRIEGAEVTVVGVLPAGFRGINADTGIDIFAPPDSIIPATAGRRPVASEILGRLKPGVTFEQAAAQLDTMWPALLKIARDATREAGEGASLVGPAVRLERMATGLSPARDNYAPTARLIFGLTSLLLLLTCVNLGGLLLTRLSARDTELGVRMAVGGSRGRIAQQMLVESVLLTGTGVVLAIPLAFAGSAQIQSFLNTGLVAWEMSFKPNVRVLLVTAAIGVLVSLLLTALPVWFAMRRQGTVRFTWDRTVTSASRRWTRGLMVVQVALSVVLVVGAALLSRSLYLIQRTETGIRSEGLLNARLMPVPGDLRRVTVETQYIPILERLSAFPGVQAATVARTFPRSITVVSSEIGFVGEEFRGVRAQTDQVFPNFFEVVGMRLLAGRSFTMSDVRKAPRVVVLTESLAKALAPDGDVVGRRVRFGTTRDTQDMQVVGVVSNATRGDLKNTAPSVMFVPALQSTTFNSANLVVRIDGGVAAVPEAVRRIVREQGTEYVFDMAMVDEVFARGPARERMSASIASVIGGLAALLALIGIHGVLAYSVSRRTREIGVRVAIGAHPARVAGGIIKEGLIITLLGVAVGLPAAYFAATALRALLFGITESDAVSFAIAGGFFLVIGALAGLLPARRAAAVDPVIALRAE